MAKTTFIHHLYLTAMRNKVFSKWKPTTRDIEKFAHRTLQPSPYSNCLLNSARLSLNLT